VNHKENSSVTDNEALLVLLLKNKKKLCIVFAAAAVITLMVTFLFAPQYKSTSVVFAVRNFSVAKLLIEANQGSQEDYMQLGDEDDLEKVLQLLNSDDLKLLVADKNDLWKRWKVENNKYALHYLKQKWEDMIRYKRTEFNSLKIEAHDYTANGAAEIANSIVTLCDTLKFRMNSRVAKKALVIVEKEYQLTLQRMNELEDSLQKLRELGILDYKSDVEAYTKSYAKALEKGNSQGVKLLEEKLNNLKKYGGRYQLISENLRKYRFKFPVIKAKYDEAQVNVTTDIPATFVVEKAKPDEYKSKPQRVIISILTAFAALLLALVLLLVNERLTNLKSKL
jgi:uncharacterized protein involved in exopolysaccharide biosynthesis